MHMMERQGAVEVVAPHGPLNHETAGGLRDTFVKLYDEGLPMVVINMSHVALVDSVGLETILDLNDELHQRGGALKLAGLSPLCQDILRVTGVAEHLEIYADVNAAVRSFVQ